LVTEYVQLLALVDSKLKVMGFSLVENNDFSAIFSHQSDKKVIFEGDKYVRPTYTIWVDVGKKSGEKFALWLFIKAFENKHGIQEQDYTLGDELDWFIKHKDEVFLNHRQYENEYHILNSV